MQQAHKGSDNHPPLDAPCREQRTAAAQHMHLRAARCYVAALWVKALITKGKPGVALYAGVGTASTTRAVKRGQHSLTLTPVFQPHAHTQGICISRNRTPSTSSTHTLPASRASASALRRSAFSFLSSGRYFSSSLNSVSAWFLSCSLQDVGQRQKAVS
jgi:hypothetical protein